MKQKFLVLGLLLFSFVAFAQGRRANQSGIHAQYGYIFPKFDDYQSEFMAKVGYNQTFGDKGFIGKAEAFYQDYNVSYSNNQILPYQKYGLAIYGGWSYEALHPVYINFYGGAYGGYEVVNDGNSKDILYNATIPTSVKGFTYGLTGGMELEVLLARRISLIADYTQYWDLKSKFSKSNGAVFGGIKFYIN